MLVCGHQPNYLPWLGFFQKLASAERFMFVDSVQYVKRGTFGWMHRNKIRNKDGWQWISLPVLSAGKREQLIVDAELKNELPWARKHWAAIEYNYRKAPFWSEYAEGFRHIYAREWTHLAPLATALIREIAKGFGIATPIEVASEVGVSGESSQLIVNITKHFGADQYLSGVHGRDYLDLDLCASQGVEVVFQDYQHPTYPQLFAGEFEAGMCALDLLFNAGPEAKAILLSGA